MRISVCDVARSVAGVAVKRHGATHAAGKRRQRGKSVRPSGEVGQARREGQDRDGSLCGGVKVAAMICTRASLNAHTCREGSRTGNGRDADQCL